MITLLKGKIFNKKGLNLCLLFGIVLFISVAVCTPMFEVGSYNRLLQNKFDDEILKNNTWPMTMGRVEKYVSKEAQDTNEYIERAGSFADYWKKYMPVDEVARQIYVKLQDYKYEREFDKANGVIGIYSMSDMDEHIAITDGEAISGEKQCLITEAMMDETGFIAGENILIPTLVDSKGEPLVLKIAGICEIADSNDTYWITNFREFHNPVLVDQETIRYIAETYEVRNIECYVSCAYDYTQVSSNKVDDIINYCAVFASKDAAFTENYIHVLNEYSTECKEIKTLFWVIELPLFALLLFFIYMVTGQILGMETGEIAIMKSRGYTRLKVIRLYIMQAAVLSIVGLVIALPIGSGLCVLAAFSDAFMEFRIKMLTGYSFTYGMLVYGLVAALVVIIIMTIPVIGYSKYSIVNEKQSRIKAMSNRAIQKFYIDILLLVVFTYLMYNYNRQKEVLSQNVLDGASIDGMMFVSVAMLIFACSLTAIRLIGYLIRLVYKLGKKHWKPHMYASFLELGKSNRKRDFISVFIIFTVALSIYQANLASTINRNNDLRAQYDNGADVVVAEKWIANKRADSENHKMIRYYMEPDYSRYESLEDKGVRMTRVIRDDNVKVVANNITASKCHMMAINTKEFGEIAMQIDNLNEEHWFNYLNALAGQSDGVLISSSLAKQTGVGVGDRITYSRINVLDGEKEENAAKTTRIVVGIFDSVPGYSRYSYEYNEDWKIEEKTENMIITNYATETNWFGFTPYEIWMNISDSNMSVADIRNFLEENGIVTEYVNSTEEIVANIRNSSKVQITNGLFSLCFMVSVAACGVGMLIYWISSMKNRAMLFGIYRAMGMSMKEVSGMIRNEQLFASVTAWLFGGLVGVVASFGCIGLIASVYLPKKHNILLKTVLDYSDIIKLLLFVMIIILICIIVMKRLIKRSNMAMAIKMGED